VSLGVIGKTLIYLYLSAHIEQHKERGATRSIQSWFGPVYGYCSFLEGNIRRRRIGTFWEPLAEQGGVGSSRTICKSLSKKISKWPKITSWYEIT